MKIAIFASGNGSNFQVLAENVQNGYLSCELAVLFCDKKDAFVLERAKQLGVPAVAFSPQDFNSKAEYEAEILKLMQAQGVDIIVLAGYMRLIGPALLAAYPQKIINIHPSLLPNFPGLHGIQDAFEAGVSETGVTVHYVDSGVDTGPVIRQGKVAILAGDTLETLEARVHQLEHQLYPAVLKEVLEDLANGDK